MKPDSQAKYHGKRRNMPDAKNKVNRLGKKCTPIKRQYIPEAKANKPKNMFLVLDFFKSPKPQYSKPKVNVIPSKKLKL